MRSTLLAGFAVLAAVTAFSVAPASAQTSGGVVITNGGHNTNIAKGKFSEADQAITTLGGTASRHGKSITNGGNNHNTALGKFSFAGQDVTTVGGDASGRGRVFTNGGRNDNTARGFNSAPRSRSPRSVGPRSGMASRSPTVGATPTWRRVRSLPRTSRL